MSWRQCTIGDFVRLQRGHDLPEPDRKPGDVPVVGSAGLTGWHNEAMCRGPCVSIGRSGASIGKATYTPTDCWPHNACLYVTDFLGNCPRFAYYLLKTIDFSSFNSGAAQPSLNRNVVHALPIRVPERQTQDRIAGAIAVYDDLIDNNCRRIALLEEAARLLYREWFVHLRYPGHEHSALVDGVPAGWTNGQLGDFLTLKRGFDLPSHKRLPGDFPIVSSAGITGSHAESAVKGPGVVTGRYGTLGEVYFMEGDYWPLNTALYVSDFKAHDPVFAFHVLDQLLRGITTQKAAVPGLDRNVLHRMPVLWPTESLQSSFLEFARDARQQIKVLRDSNSKLTSARDMLLPRLMSGALTI